MRRQRSLSRWAFTATLSAVLALLHVAAQPPTEARAVDVFDPGMIISDALFYAGTSMSTAEVQSFLDAMGASCRPGPTGTPCLRAYREDTWTRPADSRCAGGYLGNGNESAAQIITKVGASCGISPKVLLVMLQKEQSLVTASGSMLTPTRYRSAMGYGCPDSAECDARFYGFFNQVYQAAWQLRNYALTPTRWAHQPGQVNNVRYHPNAACGTSPVLILNQATASLYNYTPYQPNAAALAAGYGLGDACSSYGNRNFFLYYTKWFGSGNLPPFGVIDAVTATNTTLTVSGWTMDPDSSLSNQAHIYIDGAGVSLMADQSRPDVGAVYGMGSAHGYSYTVPARPGPHSLCVYGTSVGYGDTVLLGCRSVVVPDQVPIGEVDLLTSPGSVTLSGWTIDPDTSAATQAHVYVDGVGVALTADQTVTGLDARYGKGDAHGFTFTKALAPGTHAMCVYGINTAPGANTVLACRQFVVRATDAPPVGVIDQVSAVSGTLTLSGWAFDPDSSRPNEVHVYVDGVGTAMAADQPRPDVGAVYGRTSKAGYRYTQPIGPGQHALCVYSIGAAGGANTLVGCRSFTVADATPIGVIDAVTVAPATATASGSVTVTGWSLDPDTSESNQVHVYVDGVGLAIVANGDRPDVAAVYGRGAAHGYTATVMLGAGAHALCVHGINTSAGANALLGCRQFTVPQG